MEDVTQSYIAFSILIIWQRMLLLHSNRQCYAIFSLALNLIEHLRMLTLKILLYDLLQPFMSEYGYSNAAVACHISD